MSTLEDARAEIDEIDKQMAVLFKKRMQAVEKVSNYKKQHCLPILDTSREEDIIDKNLQRFTQPAIAPYYKDFLIQLMSISRSYQRYLNGLNYVAYQGTKGSFQSIVAQNLFPHSNTVQCATFTEIFERVETKQVAYGVVPFENSTTGDVSGVLDLCYASPCYITATYDLPVQQNLLALPGATLSDIKTVYSHIQGLEQTRRFLDSLNVACIPYDNTATATKFVAESNDKSKASIASLQAGEQYGLVPLAKDIATDVGNTTRFLILSDTLATSGNHLSLLITLQNEVGSLVNALEPIMQQGFDMECIKSRPIPKKPWEYFFYIELVADEFTDEQTEQLLASLQTSCLSVRLLGRYNHLTAEAKMKTLTVELGARSYDVVIERGGLHKLDILQDKKAFIITDDGVPAQYAKTVQQQCKEGFIFSVPQGEQSKSVATWQAALSKMVELGFTRSDRVVAVGGGVVGDLSGFVASCYMRGVPFIQVPTTTLSQIDSSIGGKVAINLDGVKNIVGNFYQPQLVMVDPDTLDSLSDRQYAAGLAEALKAGLIGNPDLFALFETQPIKENIDKILYLSLLYKKGVVERDETENNERMLLNFGHTMGHGIEAAEGLGGLLHGESIAIGMLPMIDDVPLRERTLNIMQKLNLPTKSNAPIDEVIAYMHSDKKRNNANVTIVKVQEVGKGYLEQTTFEKLAQQVKEYHNEE